MRKNGFVCLLISFCLCLMSFVAAHAATADEYGVSTKASIIFYNASIYTMEETPITVEAVLIEKGKIKAIGSNEKILAAAKKDTILIDLGGRTVLPGFIDPHTHLFNEASEDFTLDQAQQLALEYGVTAVANMYTDQGWLDYYLQYANDGNMRLRLYLYLNYNHSCGDVFGTWYESYAPGVEHAPMVWINGIKIMSERSVCNGRGPRPVFTPELLNDFTPDGFSLFGPSQLHLSFAELTDVIKRANDNGYQVAIHAIGDNGIENSLAAIKSANDNSKNKRRHMILHNYFIRDDMLDQYSESNVVALVEPTSSCHANAYVELVGEPNRRLFKRWQDLTNTGIHVGLNSDWPYFGYNSLDPMRKLYAVVTGKNSFEIYESSEPCYPMTSDQTVDVLQGLKMMTIESAYAMHIEKQLGSIKAGKNADLVVLSEDPVAVEPDDIINIKVLLTMVDGKVEYLSEDY